VTLVVKDSPLPSDPDNPKNARGREVIAAVQAASSWQHHAADAGLPQLGQALTYLRNQFDHLLVHLDNGLLPIDNNNAERLMKQVALGRKNWMFIGGIEWF